MMYIACSHELTASLLQRQTFNALQSCILKHAALQFSMLSIMIIIMCHLQTHALVAAFHIETFVSFGAVQDSLE